MKSESHSTAAKEQWEQAITACWDKVTEIKKKDSGFKTKESQENLLEQLTNLSKIFHDYLEDEKVPSEAKAVELVEHIRAAIILSKKLPEDSQKALLEMGYNLSDSLYHNLFFASEQLAINATHNKNFLESIGIYRSLIGELSELKEMDPEYLQICQNNLAAEIEKYALDLAENKKFLESIENSRAAIVEFKKINPEFLQKNKLSDRLNHLQYNLALAIDNYALDLFKNKKFLENIENLRAVIVELKKVSPEFLQIRNPDGLNHAQYNLALAIGRDALNLAKDKKFLESVENYRAAIVELKKVNPEYLQKRSPDYLDSLQRNLAIVIEEYALDLSKNKKFLESIENSRAAIVELKKLILNIYKKKSLID